MKNTKVEMKTDNNGGKFAFLFVFLTVLIGTSAVMPTSILQESGLMRDAERHVVGKEAELKHIQTGRYLKVPSRF